MTPNLFEVRRGFAASGIWFVVAIAATVALVVSPGSGHASGTQGVSSGLHREAVRSAGQSTVPTTLAPSTTVATTTTTSPPPKPPYKVDDGVLNLVDPSRSTPARGGVPASSGRVLLTVIRRPSGLTGPLPLIVFAHGWNSDPGVYEVLLDTWASAGYLVAAPTFPDSADTRPGTPVSDFAEQALDMSFVITSLLGGAEGPVDASRIAVAGHSDGGSDVDVLALDPQFADARVSAYLSMSGDIDVGLPGPWDSTRGAFEAIVGTDDQYNEQPLTTQAFDTAAMPKVMLTVQGGDHISMYLGSSPLSVALRQETLRFFAAALGHGTPTSAELAADASPTGDPAITITAGQ